MASSIIFAISDGDPTHRPGQDTNYSMAPREPLVEYKAKLGKLIGPDLEGHKPGELSCSTMDLEYAAYRRT